MFDKDYNSYIKIGKELGLKYPGGSGIENSDGTRVLEFIEYFSGTNFSFSMKYTFLELILASMNDAILNNIADSNLNARFYEYIKPILIDNRYYPHIPYWISIKSKDEFPVGYLIESYIKKDVNTNDNFDAEIDDLVYDFKNFDSPLDVNGKVYNRIKDGGDRNNAQGVVFNLKGNSASLSDVNLGLNEIRMFINNNGGLPSATMAENVGLIYADGTVKFLTKNEIINGATF